MLSEIQERTQPMKTNGKWCLDRQKYLTSEQSKHLIEYCQQASEYDAARDRKNMVIGWIMVHVGLSAGLRVAEMADLRCGCGDCCVGYGQSQIVVRNGKGGKRGEVIIGKELKRHLKAFLAAKKAWGEDVSDDAHLLLSKQKEPFTTRGLQVKFKAIARKVGLPNYFSIHCLRHSFGVELLRKSKNLRLVQKQMRHSSVTTTTVYADVCADEIQEAMDAFQ